MKVAVLATVVGYGGAEKVVLSLLENINPESFELIPVIFTRPNQMNNKFFKHIKKITARYHEIFVDNYSFKYLNPIVNLIETYKLLKQEKIDIIHTHGYRADVIGVCLSKLIGLPIISTCHGFITNDRSLLVYKLMDFIALRFFNKIITVSESIKSQLIKSGIKESLIAVILNAVTVNINETKLIRERHDKRRLFKINDKEVVIGYIGRLSVEKGIQYLIEAGEILKEMYEPFKMLIVGDGPAKKELKNLVKQKKLGSEVIFTGFQNDIENWIPALDIFVLSSLTEGTPMALLEAMAFKIPVVATNVGGIPKIIKNGINGILVEPGDSSELAREIKLLINDPILQKKIVENANNVIKLQHNVKNWCVLIEELYLSFFKQEKRINEK